MRVASTPPNLQVKLIMTSAEHLSPTGIFLIKKCFLIGIWLYIYTLYFTASGSLLWQGK